MKEINIKIDVNKLSDVELYEMGVKDFHNKEFNVTLLDKNNDYSNGWYGQYEIMLNL